MWDRLPKRKKIIHHTSNLTILEGSARFVAVPVPNWFAYKPHLIDQTILASQK